MPTANAHPVRRHLVSKETGEFCAQEFLEPCGPRVIGEKESQTFRLMQAGQWKRSRPEADRDLDDTIRLHGYRAAF